MCRSVHDAERHGRLGLIRVLPDPRYLILIEKSVCFMPGCTPNESHSFGHEPSGNYGEGTLLCVRGCQYVDCTSAIAYSALQFNAKNRVSNKGLRWGWLFTKARTNVMKCVLVYVVARKT